jgi:hypothetical protein
LSYFETLKNSLRFLCLLLLAQALTARTPAEASIRLTSISFFAGGNLPLPRYQYNTSGTLTSATADTSAGSGLAGYSIGAAVTAPLLSFAEVEFGALVGARNFELLVSTPHGVGRSEAKATTAEIPVLIRFPFNLCCSIGVGGYYERYIHSTPLGSRNWDGGALISASWSYSLARNLDVLLDGRFKYGLVEQSLDPSGAETLKFSALEILAGIAIVF